MSDGRVFAGWIPRIGEGREMTGLYRAHSAGQAKAACLAHAREAGYDVRLPDVRVRREPAYDAVNFRVGISLEYAPPAPEAKE